MRTVRTIASLSLAVLLVHGAASANPVAYLTHATTGRVSVLDVVTGAMVADIPVDQGPEALAASPDGERVYVLNRCGHRPTSTGYCDDFGEPGTPGTISVIDTATNQVVETIDTVRYANGLTIAPDGKRLYVTTPCSPGNVLPCARGFASIIDTASGDEIERIQIGGYPFAPAVTKDGGSFIVPLAEGQLRIFDLAGGGPGDTLTVGAFPQSAAALELRRIVVANGGDGAVSIIDGTTLQEVGIVPVGFAPAAVVIRQDGARAYVANMRGASLSSNVGTVSVIDPETATSVTTITVGATPTGLDLDADAVYVAGSEDLRVIDIATNAVVATFPIAAPARGVAVVDRSGGGCDDEVTLASVACRIDALDALVTEHVTDDELRIALGRTVDRVRRNVARAIAATEAGAAGTAHSRLRHASRAMGSFRHRIRSLVGRRRISRDVRKALLELADPLDANIRRLVRGD